MVHHHPWLPTSSPSCHSAHFLRAQPGIYMPPHPLPLRGCVMTQVGLTVLQEGQGGQKCLAPTALEEEEEVLGI